jgi:hypothetical protein
MYADSSEVRFKKSAVVPIFQPEASSFARLSACIIVHPESELTYINDRLRRSCGFLLKHFSDHDGVNVYAIDNPPDLVTIGNSQLVTMRPY